MATTTTRAHRLFGYAPTRRGLFRGGVGVTAAAALAACGSADAASGGSTLHVWGGVPPESGPGALVEAFEAAYPGRRVVYTRFVNDDRGNLKLDSALQGGVDIDVYFTYATDDLALRTGAGLALDLADRLAGDRELAPFLDRSASTSFWQGDAVTALATTREPNMVLLNESRLQEAGYEVPTEWDMLDLESMVRDLAVDGRYGAYTLPDSARIALGPNYWYADDGGSNFRQPEFLEHVARSRRLIDEGVLFPWTEVLARQLAAYQQNAFVGEEFALWVTAPFNLRYLADPDAYPHDFRVAAAPVPTTSAGEWNTGIFGNFVMINPRSRRQDLAWDFVRFWVTEGSAYMAPGGKIPTLQNVSTEHMLGSLLGDEADDWFDVDSFRRVLFDTEPELVVDTDLTAFPEISLAVQQQHDLCWIGERSPEHAIAEIDRQAAAAIERYGAGR